MESLTIDASQFVTSMKKNITVDRARVGLGTAGMQLMNDCVMQIPTVPLREGMLRGSGSVHVENDLIGVSKDLLGNGTPAIGNVMNLTPNQLVAIIGFNTHYAAYMHEHPEFNFTTPGSGGKFMEIPMSVNKTLYIGIIARKIRKG